MATFKGTTNNDVLDASTGTITGFTGGTLAELHDLIGDLIEGGGGYDSVVAGNGNDTIYAATAGGSLNGGGGDDFIQGGGSHDILIGGAGHDSLFGGAGYDLFYFFAGQTVDDIDGGADYGRLDFTAYTTQAVTLNLNTGTYAVSGLGSGTVTGIEDILSGGGNDSLTGDGGSNGFFGGSGRDTLNGGAGDDVLYGEAGADRLTGGAGIDLASYYDNLGTTGVSVNLATGRGFGGDAQGDTLIGIENIDGSLFADTLIGDGAGNVIRGGGFFEGFDGRDFIDGGAGDDWLSGDIGADTIIGGLGNDTIDGVTGADSLVGGAGFDIASFSSRAVFDMALGINLTDGDTVSGFEGVSGSYFGDSVTGDAAANLLSGQGGADTLDGGAGNDTVDGGDQGDSLRGGAGSDTLYGGASDLLADTLDGGAGADFLDGGPSAQYVEDLADYQSAGGGVVINLLNGTGVGDIAQGDTLVGIEGVLGSAFNDSLTGDGGANSLEGGLGGDLLDGLAGDDALVGGAGGDTLLGGAGVDWAYYSSSTGGVTVNLATGTGSGGDAQGDTLVGIENLTGSNFADTLIGDAANNFFSGSGDVSNDGDYLDGAAGADTLWGLIGNDTLKGGAGADSINGSTGIDSAVYAGSATGVTVNLQSKTATGGDAQGDKLSSIEGLVGSSFNDNLTGAVSFKERLDGGAGNDFLDGLGKADTLIGGAGNDTLNGGTDKDRFDFTAGFGQDRILDFTAGAGAGDVIRLTGLGPAFDTFAEVVAAATQIGADTVIDLGGGNAITLIGVVKASLAADDFTFS